MMCSDAYRTDEFHGWGCKITGGACAFLVPDEETCSTVFNNCEADDGSDTPELNDNQEAG